MPVIKSAIKKQRQDKKRQKENDAVRDNLEAAVRVAKKNPKPAQVSKASSIIDKAVKKNLIHKNKAARMKSSLSKLSKTGPKTTTTTKVISKKAAKAKKASKKTKAKTSKK